MKNILFSFFLIVSASVANAGTTVVNPGSDSGGFHAVLSFISKQIDGDFVQAGNPVVAGSHFDKENVLINRGWIKKEFKNSLDINTLSKNIQGMLRQANRKNIFTPDNDINENIWYRY